MAKGSVSCTPDGPGALPAAGWLVPPYKNCVRSEPFARRGTMRSQIDKNDAMMLLHDDADIPQKPTQRIGKYGRYENH